MRSSILKRKVHTKINEQVDKSLYIWILQHPQVVQYPISNNCLKVYIDGHSEPQLVPICLLQLSVRELRNSTVSLPEDGGFKEARDAETNIIFSDYTLQSILPPQLKNMSAQYKVICGC